MTNHENPISGPAAEALAPVDKLADVTPDAGIPAIAPLDPVVTTGPEQVPAAVAAPEKILKPVE